MTTHPKVQSVDFEKYLEQVCFEANPSVLDDDMPDFFEAWLSNQDGEDYIRLANEYATTRDTALREALAEEVEKYAGKVFGIEVIVSEELNNKDFSEGFAKGKAFMKEQIQALIRNSK